MLASLVFCLKSAKAKTQDNILLSCCIFHSNRNSFQKNILILIAEKYFCNCKDFRNTFLKLKVHCCILTLCTTDYLLLLLLCNREKHKLLHYLTSIAHKMVTILYKTICQCAMTNVQNITFSSNKECACIPYVLRSANKMCC